MFMEELESIEVPWLDTSDPQKFVKNAAKFNQLMMKYRCAIREIRTKFEVLDDEFSVQYKRNPISFIKTRIKKPESIYRKLQKKGLEFTPENIQEQLHDVAGIRVVCSFVDDIYTVAGLLSDQDDVTVLEIRDYIKNPKPNGYRSYHMIVEIPVFFSEGKTPIKAEIQIRTIGMDFWATLEHQIRYKKGIEGMDGYEDISQELLRCAQTVIDMDSEMQNIKNMIGQFHDI
ncbi:MAG: GTP pyrophosphokinase family protein [Eubacteriales bacterium]|nr:GTP pyrophosphokinase family protein [Eubacteriales bacterium]